MDSVQLDCFLLLAETRNFTKAAKAMFITQPAFSRRIAALEQAVGAKLFERQYQNVRLTAAGALLLPFCRRARAELEEGVALARRSEAGAIGTLRIGVLRDAREEQVSRAVRRFRVRYPEVEVAVSEYAHLRIGDALSARRIDVGFFNSQHIDKMEKIHSLKLGASPQCVVVPEWHPLAACESVNASQLEGEKFVFLPREDSPYYDILREVCDRAGVAFKVAGWGEVVTALFTLVGCGVGISFLSDKTALLAPASLRYVKLNEAPLVDHLAIWRQDNHNPCLHNFLSLLDAPAI